MSKDEFVDKAKADMAARKKQHIRDVEEYHMSAIGKQRKVRRRMKAQRAI
jgi:hypothetical protein